MTETELLLSIIKDVQAHILIINEEMGGIQTDVAVLKNQMGELMWMTRVVTVAVIGVVIERGARIYIGWRDKKDDRK